MARLGRGAEAEDRPLTASKEGGGAQNGGQGAACVLPAETWWPGDRPAGLGERSEQDWNDPPPFSLVPGQRSAWGAGRGRRAAEAGWLLGGGTAPGELGQGAGLGAQLSLGRLGASRDVSWHPVRPAAGALPAGWPLIRPCPAISCSCWGHRRPHRKQAWILLPGCLPTGLLLNSQCSSLSCLTPGDGAGSAHSFSCTLPCILKTIYAHRHSFQLACQALFLFCPSGLCQRWMSLSLPTLQRKTEAQRGREAGIAPGQGTQPLLQAAAPCPQQMVPVQ